MYGRDRVMAWVDKAEEDYELALMAMRHPKGPLTGGACYHGQQCVEKYLKAFLTYQSRPFPHTHDLLALKDLCGRADPFFVLDEDLLERLNAYAVGIRYPGEEATVEEAREAVTAMRTVRRFVRGKLELTG